MNAAGRIRTGRPERGSGAATRPRLLLGPVLRSGIGRLHAPLASRLAALVLCLCSWLGAPAQAQPLTIAVSRGPVSLPVLVADARQFFAQEGLDVRTLKCSSGRECLKLMSDGLANVATAAELAVVLASGERSDLAIIATLSTSSHQIKLVARRSAGINAPGDLAGKRIGTVMGTSAQYFLVNWLLYHGIEPGKVSVEPVPPDQLAAELASGRLDAIAIWEPLASGALQDLRSDGLVLPNPRVYLQHFSLVTTRKHLGEHEDQLLRLLRALLRAQQFIADEPAKARQVLSTRLGLSITEAEQNFAEHDYRVRLDQSLAGTLAAEARWAAREGLLKPETPAGAAGPGPGGTVPLVEPRLLLRAAPAAVTLVR
jgi:ABC-type nitrate/sulfonate/bicarbonate transport system substrate-binding protein